MKLKSDDTKNLTSLISAATMCGIDAVVVIDGKVRGINPAKTCVMLSTENVPAFSQKIGLGRLKELQSRLSVFSGKSDVVIDAKENDRGEISSIEISSGRNKVQYRCTSTVMLNDGIPKNVPDAFSPAYKVFIDKEEMKTTLDAIRVMGSKRITFCIKADRSVSITAMDSGNDNFTVSLATPAERITEDEDTIVNYYSVDVFAPIIKELMQFDTAVLHLGERGTLSAKMNGHMLIMLPQIGDDTEEE